MFINNLTVRNKIRIGFISLTLLAMVVGIVGIVSVTFVSSQLDEMHDNALSGIDAIRDINTSISKMRANITMIANENFSSRIPESISEISELEKNIETRIKDYEASIFGNEEDIVLFNEFKTLNSEYKADREHCISLAQAGDYNAVDNFFNNELRVSREKIESKMSELITLNEENAANILETSLSSVNIAYTLIISIVVFIMIIAFTITVIIVRAIITPIDKLMTFASSMAEGDLTANIDITTKDELGKLAANFTTMKNNINEILKNIREASEQVNSGAGQVAASSTNLSEGSQTQASAIEEITASMMDIEGQTKQNAKNADEATNLSTTAKQNAEEGNREMGEMLLAMKEINESSNSISKVIKVIDDIAFQTNILALNAAVEAARAGQHGKGFAVVAEEVRNLAIRSASAVKETSSMLEGSMSKVNKGTELANNTAEALEKIVSSVISSSEIVADIAIASGKQANAIAEVTSAIEQVSKVVQTNSATSEEAAAASQELSGQANLLDELVGKFKLDNVSGGFQRNNKSQFNNKPYKSSAPIRNDVPVSKSYSPAPTLPKSTAKTNGNGSTPMKTEEMLPPINISLDDDLGKY